MVSHYFVSLWYKYEMAHRADSLSHSLQWERAENTEMICNEYLVSCINQ